MTTMLEPTGRQELDDVRGLLRAFVAWHRDRHVEDLSLIDRYFDEAEFEAELAALPGHYARPKGRLLVAYVEGEPAGCVAMRDLGDGFCEMKRMFVPPRFRGQGIGRALARGIIREAAAAGYAHMRLDTSHRQAEAMKLYEAEGFRQVPPYYELSADLRAWLVFFERPLQPPAAPGLGRGGLAPSGSAPP